jgi:hypothetical protein
MSDSDSHALGDAYQRYKWERPDVDWDSLDVVIELTDPEAQAMVMLMYVPKHMLSVCTWFDMLNDSVHAQIVARIPVVQEEDVNRSIYTEFHLLSTVVPADDRPRFATMKQVEDHVRVKLIEFVTHVRITADITGRDRERDFIDPESGDMHEQLQ